MSFRKLESEERFVSESAGRTPLIHTPEPPAEVLMKDPTRSVYVGKTKIHSIPFYWDCRPLANPHIAILGLTGTGKSYTVKAFLTRASMVWDSNSIIIDWANEYPEWVQQANGKVIRLGEGDHINLLDTAGMAPVIRAKQIINALCILTGLDKTPSEKRLLHEAIEETYKKKGFSLSAENQTREPPTLHDVLDTLNQMREEEGDQRIKRDLRDTIYRVKQFTQKGADYLAHKSTVKLDDMLTSGLVDICLQALPTEEMRSLIGLSILQFIVQKMRKHGWSDEKDIDLIVVLDEAWKIAKDERSDAITIVREGRKYNFMLFIASQNPTDLHQTILSQVGTTFVFRIKHDDSLDYLKKSLKFSDYIHQKIESFGVGECMVHQIYHKQMNVPDCFLLDIHGEEPIIQYQIEFTDTNKGDRKMPQHTFEKDEILDKIRKLGISPEDVMEIERNFEVSGRKLSSVTLTITLEKMGVKRSNILNLFRSIGASEEMLKATFLAADQKHSEPITNVAELILKEK